jgi:hypothetical protein
MKKLCCLFSVCLLLVCCKKPVIKDSEDQKVNITLRKGLPPDPDKINAYLYASYALDRVNGAGTMNRLTLFASFSDPAKELMMPVSHRYDYIFQGSEFGGNVQVNELSFNNNIIKPTVFGEQSVVYVFPTQNVTSSNNLSARWKHDGNRGFKPIDVLPERGFVVPVNVAASFTLDADNGDTIKLNNLNFDTLFVDIGSLITKTIVPPQSEVVFSREELSQLSTGGYGINFSTFNYSSMVLDDKIYLFELSVKLKQTTFIKKTSNKL